MQAAGHGAFGGMHGEELAHFLHHVGEVARLVAVGAGHGVAVHGVAAPDHGAACIAHRAHQRRQQRGQLARAHAGDEHHATGFVRGVERIEQRQHLIGRGRGANLDAHRVGDAAQVVDVRAIQLARALAQPQHVGRGAKPAAAGVFARPRQRFLIRQQQGFVGGVEAHLAQLRRVVAGEAHRRHEGQRLADAARQLGIALALRAGAHEVGGPRVQLVQIGKAALGQRAQQVERGGAGRVGAQQALRLRRSFVGRKARAVDDVAPVARQGHAALSLAIGRARLGVLTGDAADLDHGSRSGVGQHHRHLQQHAKGLARRFAIERVEALRAIAALQQEGAAGSDLGQLLAQRAHLAVEDERRKLAQLIAHGIEPRRVGVHGHLARRPLAPGGGVPSGVIGGVHGVFRQRIFEDSRLQRLSGKRGQLCF